LEEYDFLSEEAEANSEPLAPFAVDQNGNWFPDSRNNRSGDFVNILLKTAFFDSRYFSYTLEFLDKILNQTIRDPCLKDYYSLAFASEIGFISEERRNLFRERSLEAALLEKNLFLERLGFFSSIDDMEKTLFFSWAFNSSNKEKEGFDFVLSEIVKRFTENNILKEDNKILIFPYVDLNTKERYVLDPFTERTIPFTGENYLIKARDSAKLIQIYSLLGHYSNEEESSNLFRIAEKITNQNLQSRNSNYFINSEGVGQGPIDNTYYAILAKGILTLLNYSPSLEDQNSLIQRFYFLMRRLTLPENLNGRNKSGILNNTCNRINGIYRNAWIYGDKNLFDCLLLFPTINPNIKTNSLDELIMRF
jgi:hypothetical protein